MSRADLLGLLPSEMERLAEDLGAPSYRGRQLAVWLYKKGVFDWGSMTNLPKEFRSRLAERAAISIPSIERVIPSRDGSRKFILLLGDGARIHSVLIPDEDRLTLCLSTQVGCGFACAFCFTGTMGLGRDLTTAEIVGQLAVVVSVLPDTTRVTHLVFMGMGEPMANYTATVKAIRVFTDSGGFGYSPRRIAVSTVGLVGGIQKLAKEKLNVNLAISLHATTDALRKRLMPVNRGWSLEDLLAACRRFPLPVRRRMTFEYILLDGVNDSPKDAVRLARLLKGIRAKVNLIPFNPWEGSDLRRPPIHQILAFQKLLLEHGLLATIRWSKGEDVGAACGQLNEPRVREAISA